MSTIRARANGVARTTAAFLGTLPDALFASIALCRFLPLAEDERFAIGFLLGIPLWIAGICLVYLQRSGLRAWALCVVSGVLLGLLALR